MVEVRSSSAGSSFLRLFETTRGSGRFVGEIQLVDPRGMFAANYRAAQAVTGTVQTIAFTGATELCRRCRE